MTRSTSPIYLHSMAFTMVLYHFIAFYSTNLLTQCQVPVSVFIVCALRKRRKIKFLRKFQEKYQNSKFSRRTRRTKTFQQGSPTATMQVGPAGQEGQRPLAVWPPPRSPRSASSPI